MAITHIKDRDVDVSGQPPYIWLRSLRPICEDGLVGEFDYW